MLHWLAGGGSCGVPQGVSAYFMASLPVAHGPAPLGSVGHWFGLTCLSWLPLAVPARPHLVAWCAGLLARSLGCGFWFHCLFMWLYIVSWSAQVVGYGVLGDTSPLALEASWGVVLCGLHLGLFIGLT